jgi:D-3-phosphoglycerate dehydrogenase
VVATPHLAGSSRQVAQFSAATVVGQVAQYLRSGMLDHCANPETLAGPADPA